MWKLLFPLNGKPNNFVRGGKGQKLKFVYGFLDLVFNLSGNFNHILETFRRTNLITLPEALYINEFSERRVGVELEKRNVRSIQHHDYCTYSAKYAHRYKKAWLIFQQFMIGGLLYDVKKHANINSIMKLILQKKIFAHMHYMYKTGSKNIKLSQWYWICFQFSLHFWVEAIFQGIYGVKSTGNL